MRAWALLAALAAVPSSSRAQPPVAIPIYVTPYYDSTGPKINVGKFSAGLASGDAGEFRATIKLMAREFPALTPEAMYVAAVRLYDYGDRDAALYWFYSAQYRARLFQALLDPQAVGRVGEAAFETQQAQISFHQLSGEFINGYAGCSLDNWLAVIARVSRENAKAPDFAKIYPAARFIPRGQWAARNKEIAKGLAGLADSLKEGWPEMRATRKLTGVQAKFCGAAAAEEDAEDLNLPRPVKERLAATAREMIVNATIAYGAEHGENPKNLAVLVPKYLARIPALSLPDHEKTARVRIIVNWTGDSPSPYLKDTGGWIYFAPKAAGDPGARAGLGGSVYADCTHKGADGAPLSGASR